MASDHDSPPAKPPKFSPDDVLPPVEPPSMAFLLQLFVIPLMIVVAIVGVWFLFSWLASSGSDPQQIVREIDQRMNWQSAVTLSSMLDNPDSRYEQLRRDPEFARQIGEVLQRKLETPLTKQAADEPRRKICYVLCRALGNMETEAALAPLVEVAGLNRNVAEVDVRLGALEGIALLAANLGPESIRTHKEAMKVILDCSRASDAGQTPQEDQSPDYQPYGELRGAAAYALGVIGGEPAIDRLVQMLEDVYPSARYNAATGLARQGDVRAVPVLAEMVDPENDVVAKEEKHISVRDARRVQVLNNGIKATLQLAETASADSLGPVKKSLESAKRNGFPNIEDASTRRAVGLHAQEALRRLAD